MNLWLLSHYSYKNQILYIFCKSYALSFRGEKEKREFYDIGVKKNSVLSLTEVHEGETKKEKNKRNKKKQVKDEEDDYIIIFE